MNEPRVLVIDDDDDIRGLVVELLQRAGLDVDQAPDGRAGLRAFHQSPADLIVLDVSMPELDGWETLERIRDLSDVPVIMLTARGAELERVRGLQAGADDYMVKPFSPRELVARVRAVLRRAGGGSQDVIQLDDLTLDRAGLAVERAGKKIELTATEFQILVTLAAHPGRLFTRAQLLDAIRGADSEPFERAIDAHVKNIRRKIEPDPRNPRYVLTVYGVGYKAAGE
jgi:DNA-binding response OmpR family regulator